MGEDPRLLRQRKLISGVKVLVGGHRVGARWRCSHLVVGDLARQNSDPVLAVRTARRAFLAVLRRQLNTLNNWESLMNCIGRHDQPRAGTIVYLLAAAPFLWEHLRPEDHPPQDPLHRKVRAPLSDSGEAWLRCELRRWRQNRRGRGRVSHHLHAARLDVRISESEVVVVERQELGELLRRMAQLIRLACCRVGVNRPPSEQLESAIDAHVCWSLYRCGKEEEPPKLMHRRGGRELRAERSIVLRDVFRQSFFASESIDDAQSAPVRLRHEPNFLRGIWTAELFGNRSEVANVGLGLPFSEGPCDFFGRSVREKGSGSFERGAKLIPPAGENLEKVLSRLCAEQREHNRAHHLARQAEKCGHDLRTGARGSFRVHRDGRGIRACIAPEEAEAGRIAKVERVRSPPTKEELLERLPGVVSGLLHVPWSVGNPAVRARFLRKMWIVLIRSARCA